MIAQDILLEFLKLGRVEFAGFLCGVTLSGALALQGGALNARNGVALLAIALLTNLWGFIHNDICDAEIDQSSASLSTRPLVSGTLSKKSAWVVVLACILSTLACVILNTSGTWPILIILGAAFLGFQYNVWSKRLPGSDLIFAASTALMCLLGAVLVSEGSLGSGPAWNLVWTVVAIQFLDHILFNAGATLKDVKNDSMRSAVTMATFSGVTVGEGDTLSVSRRFQGYIVMLKAGSLVILFASPLWTGMGFGPVQLVFLISVAIASLFLTTHAVNMITFDRREIGRRWVRQEAMGKLLIPLLLLPIAGAWACFLLVAIPFAWFLLSNVLLYRRGTTLNSGF